MPSDSHLTQHAQVLRYAKILEEVIIGQNIVSHFVDDGIVIFANIWGSFLGLYMPFL